MTIEELKSALAEVKELQAFFKDVESDIEKKIAEEEKKQEIEAAAIKACMEMKQMTMPLMLQGVRIAIKKQHRGGVFIEYKKPDSIGGCVFDAVPVFRCDMSHYWLMGGREYNQEALLVEAIVREAMSV